MYDICLTYQHTGSGRGVLMGWRGLTFGPLQQVVGEVGLVFCGKSGGLPLWLLPLDSFKKGGIGFVVCLGILFRTSSR